MWPTKVKVATAMIKNWDLWLIAIVLAFYAMATAEASDWHVVDLTEASLNYRNYALLNPNARNLLIYPEHAKEGIDVGLKMDLLSYGYFDSQIESLTTDAQYRSIGLQFGLGLRVTDYLNVGYWHHSQHVLDRGPQSYEKFPSEDALEVRITGYRARSP